MHLNDYQLASTSFAMYPGRNSGDRMALAYTALGLVGEAGEYSEKVKKLIRDGAFDKYEAAKELGDVLWYLSNCASELGFTLETIAGMNLKKLTDRQERGKISGEGDNR